MNFDLDDPLEGLLSDGSNDSLFGDEKAKKPAQSSKPGKMEDLFGIKPSEASKSALKVEQPSTAANKSQPASLDYSKPPSTTSTIHQPSSLTSVQGKKPVTPVKKTENATSGLKPSTPQKKEISFDDSDLLSDLGFDPKKPRAKSSILDDILGVPMGPSTKEVPSKSTLAKPRPSLPVAKEEATAAAKNVSRQSTETSDNLPPENTILGGYAPTGGGSAVLPRRSGRRKSSVSALNDPLGLFATDDKAVRRESKQPKKGGADWLGLNEDSVSNEADPLPTPVAKPVVPPVPVVPVPIQKPAELPVPVRHDPEPPKSEGKMPVQPTMSDPLLISNTLQLVDAETESALVTMQQQDFQISVASQMKTQEKALLDMQQKQRSILQRQEAQFNELLQKQMQRHTALEEVLTRQQERISANIQLIMNQPPPTALSSHLEGSQPYPASEGLRHEPQPEDLITKIELQSEVKRLEMEKLRLEDLVSNLTTNHGQELSLLEASYKKQIGFLEESLKIMETRLKDDNRKLEEFYQRKIDAIEEEKCKLAQDNAGKMREMEENHRSAVEKLKQAYEDNLEQLRQDHRDVIGSIRESKMLEFSAVHENQSYLQTLKNASSYLENASGDLQQLRDTLHDQIEFCQKEKDLQLKAREKQLEDQQRLLERTRAAASEEKDRLLNLVEALESKVTEMTKVSSEERWEYRQKCVKLEAERSSFEKEKQFFRERHQHEEARIGELKQAQLDESARFKDKLNQERQALLEEKAKFETMAQLHSKVHPGGGSGLSSRAEVEAAVKVAEEATHQADKEKERYLQLQRQFEAKRRELLSRESQLRETSAELESAIERARLRERNAENVYQGVRKAEQNAQLKMQLVQRQFREVSEREDRLAKDKIEFSKERLELQAIRRKLQQNRCSLCKIGEKSQEIGDLLTTNTDSVADDLKLEASFAEMQQRLDTTELKLDQLFDNDVDRHMKLFFERTRLEQLDVAAGGLDAIVLNDHGHARESDSETQLKLENFFSHLNENQGGDRK
ncbi:fas-binding factor 1 homolog [Anopheles bellator]|uniref:fas-binding factor 1 homolog n=1 Tax=Anopheles bellator TaxID=139047 RepID=UPI0026483080|nr:fas-binding factor 1 homolog [Anopheles bellator]